MIKAFFKGISFLGMVKIPESVDKSKISIDNPTIEGSVEEVLIDEIEEKEIKTQAKIDINLIELEDKKIKINGKFVKKEDVVK